MALAPDDFAARKYHCAVPNALTGEPCNAKTGRRIGTNQIPVCAKHFIEGWGRLPNMPLPEPEPGETPPLYVSKKDKPKSTRRR